MNIKELNGMKVGKAAQDYECCFEGCCSNHKIRRNQVYIRVSVRRKVGTVIKWVNSTYHADCYIQAQMLELGKIHDAVNSLQVTLHKRKSDKPVGRPPKTKNPLEYRRLYALRSYHDKQGNMEDVARCDKLIDKLRFPVEQIG